MLSNSTTLGSGQWRTRAIGTGKAAESTSCTTIGWEDSPSYPISRSSSTVGSWCAAQTISSWLRARSIIDVAKAIFLGSALVSFGAALVIATGAAATTCVIYIVAQRAIVVGGPHPHFVRTTVHILDIDAATLLAFSCPGSSTRHPRFALL